MAVTNDGPASLPEPSAVAISVLLALVAHQIFRNYETYSIPTHVALLLAPPALVTAFSAPLGYTLGRALIVYSTYFATLVFSIVAYRLSPFHPLARYPGPVGCKISKFYLGFVSCPGFQHKYLKSLHDRYGDVVRIGPNELSICNASLIPPLLGNNGVPKGPLFVGRMLSDKGLPLVGIQELDVHLNRRKNWSRGMRQGAIKEYEELIESRIRQLIARLEEQTGTVDIGDWFSFFTYDFMSDMAFGGGSELLDAGHDKGNVWKLLDDAMFIATFFGHLPWLGVYVGKIPAATGNLMKLLNYCVACATARVQRGSKTKDLFHYLNQEDLPDAPPPPMQQLVDDGVLAIIAGSDTTSAVLTSVIYCLLTHPDVYEKLQAEVDKYYPQGENALNPKHHRDMSYLTAVINESMRVFPAVPTGTQRQVPRDSSGVVVGDLYIPPGTVFVAPTYAHHLDPRNFSPNPAAFWPERWLLALDEKEARGEVAGFAHNETAFLAFSHGPMNCVGKTLAMLEMRLVLCALLQRFTFRQGEGWDAGSYERNYRDYFTAPRPELPVVLEVRQ